MSEDELAELKKTVRELTVRMSAEEIILKLLNTSLLELRKQVEHDEEWLISVSQLARHALQHAEVATTDGDVPAFPKKPGERDIEVA